MLELLSTRTECSTLVFNRRFCMRDGTVLTNPGKLNENIDNLEGGMEASIQQELGFDIPVMTLIGVQSNINHFNVKTAVNQTGYEEAIRIGFAYGAVILSSLYQLQPIFFEQMKIDSCELDAPYFVVTDAEYESARCIAEKYKDAKMEDGQDFTSEDIDKGHPFVKKFFAERSMACRDNKTLKNA